MAYKDKSKQLQHKKKWQQENPEKYKNSIKKANDKRWLKQYSPFYNKIKSYNIDVKAEILYEVNKKTRKKIYRYFIIPFSDQIEEKICNKKRDLRSKYYKHWYSSDLTQHNKILKRIVENRNKKQHNIRMEKYSSIYLKIRSYDICQKAEYLCHIHQKTREKVYRYFIIPFPDQIEEKVSKLIKKRWWDKQKPLQRAKMAIKWEDIKKRMTTQGCDCGEKKITKLSFHHLNPLEKDNSIRKMCSHSIERINKEFKKGVVKCKNCHTIIHIGTSKEREDILIKRYLRSPTNKKTLCRNHLMIWEFKKSLFCINCKINDPAILLFHHVESDLKYKKISIMHKEGRGKISKELSKTVCLCHNCHEDFHYSYGTKTTQYHLESYIGKKITPLKIDINSYLPYIDYNISKYYKLAFLL